MSGEKFTYRVRHQTTYRYSGRIDLCHSLAHLRPRREKGQKVKSCEITIVPEPDYLSEREDYLGNSTLHFSIQEAHKSLDVISEVIVRKKAGMSSPEKAGVSWDALNAHPGDLDADGIRLGHFLFFTPACPKLDSVREFLQPSLTPGSDVLDVAGNLMGRVYDEFAYSPGATQISTPLGEVMQLRKGVCQDFAHVMISALRTAGIPTRYVSGYLETLPPPGKQKLRGADASHAWIEVWAPECGWVGFDPTNNKRPGDRHIKICHGRDYFDVQPIRGLFVGSGAQRLQVAVDVERM